MLRASSETHEQTINLDAIMDGGATGEILQGAQLSEFAAAIVSADARLIAKTREALIEVAGHASMVDAAGVASNFQRMTRIADSTGIVLGDFETPTAELRQALGINTFKSG